MKESIEIYKPDFIDKVLGYLINYDYLGIEVDKVYKFNKKEKQILENIKRQYRKISLYKDAKYEYLKELEPQLVFDIANLFLTEIFPNLTTEILDMDEIISFEDIDTSEEGLFYRIKHNYVELEKIILDTTLNEYMVSKIVHEKTHALCFNHFDTIELFSTGLELFPIFIQKMVIYELEKYTDSPVAIFDTIIRNNDNRIGTYYLDYAHYLNNKSNKTELDKQVSHYFRIRSTDYILADVYSNVLMEYYIRDRNIMLENINKLFKAKITISEFLNIYDINLLNKENIPILKEKLEKCKRKIIIP